MRETNSGRTGTYTIESAPAPIVVLLQADRSIASCRWAAAAAGRTAGDLGWKEPRPASGPGVAELGAGTEPLSSWR